MKTFREISFYVAYAAGLAFGTSSFTMIAGLFKEAPATGVVIGIIVAGLLCCVVAASVAELGSLFPSTPGVRTYFKAAYGDRTSLFMSYLYIFFMLLVAGVESFMFALVLNHLLPSLPPIYSIVFLFALTICLNLYGADLPQGFQVITTVALILAVACAGYIGTFYSPESVSNSREFGMLNLMVISSMAIYLYIGFEWTTLVALRQKSYAKSIPIGMMGAILVNAVAYSTFSIGMGRVLDYESIVSSPLPQIYFLTAIIGDYGKWAALILSAGAITSTFNAGLMGGARLIFVLAREGKLPKFCAAISIRRGTPVGAVLTLGCLALTSSVAIMLGNCQLEAAIMGSAIVSLAYGMFCHAAIRLRRHPTIDNRRHFVSPFPNPVQRLVSVIIPSIGIFGLFTEVRPIYIPISGLLACSICSLVLVARYSQGTGTVRRRADG